MNQKITCCFIVGSEGHHGNFLVVAWVFLGLLPIALGTVF